MRQIFRICDFLLEPQQHTLVFLNDIDRLLDHDIDLINECIRSSDAFVSTYVPDYRSDEFRTERHLSIAKKSIVIPNIYFFGIKPNIGELLYPDGTRGYEDIWIYNYIVNASPKISLEELIDQTNDLEIRLYSSTETSFDLSDFARLCLSSSLDSLVEREEIISALCQRYPDSTLIRISLLLASMIKSCKEPPFYTTDHPSIQIMLSISLLIIEKLGLSPSIERLTLLENGEFSFINTTSTDFIYFQTPLAYLKGLGLVPSSPRSYIEYKPRFSTEQPVAVSLRDYISQLYYRISKTSESLIISNLKKISKYSEMRRVLDLRLL
jgi:hypothetical protein